MITVRIFTPEGAYRTVKDVTLVNLETIDGQRGILPRHMPIVLMLDIGTMTLVQGDKRETYTVSGGMFYFENDLATILTDAIENVEDIDLDRAERAKKRAEERLARQSEKVDRARAEMALKRAINRISARQVR